MADNALMRKLWHWFDEYFLLAATAFLIVFIPLYPKIPLADIIPGYIVRIRLEDVFVALALFWWLIQLLRKKVTWRTPLSLAILAYVLVGLVSNILGVILTGTIPAELLHFGKSTLHWLRHIQYFSLFFMAYSAVSNRRQAQILIGSFIVALLGVMVYGYGQKYWYWPVYSTMNREFSKGIRLYLGEHARVQSTFAGHYDLGGYLVLVESLALSLYFYMGGMLKKAIARSKKLIIAGRWLTAFAWFGGLWLLVMSASRASFGGFLVGAGLVTLLYMRRRGLWWGISRGLVVLLISSVMFVFVGDLSTRFAQIIDQNKYPQLTETFHQINDLRKHPLLAMGVKVNPPDGAKSTDDLERELNEQGLTVSDTQPTTNRPTDVYSDIPEKEYDLDDPEATKETGLVQQGDKLVKERVYSDCSLQHSLSVCIRIETLWPRALEGFYSNPLFGSGYATLTKATVEQFTEAESTDNNFLRTLGENGALGFFFYYGSIGLAIWYSIETYRRSDDPWLQALAIANIAGTSGLLLNALYIDIFIASKVAYTFWTMQGVYIAIFVKEGVITPQFDLAGLQKKKDASQLSSLLSQAEKKASSKTKKSKYLSGSKKKRRQRSSKKSKTKVRQS